ncbi:B3 DNA binding domain containing protein [Parasponia andersonii]|uniref:B3 DNA binding domain containing protein n=1 Tax=Parasponia andersonii TaxID=3476 RepID=A0A2P5CH95_PARAD|nr:B3 DNA binding domain containing protein [Parasponia andersonii]
MASMRRNRLRRVTPGGNHHRQSDSPPTPPPLFAAVMLEKNILEHKMRIPTKFAMIFGEQLSEVATLTVPDGKTWHVRLKKEREKNIWLLDGFKEFMNYYSIHYGHILLFIYQGSSEFSVRICEGIGSEIDYPNHGPAGNDIGEPNLDNHNEEDMADHDDQISVEILDSDSSLSHGSSDKHEEHTSDGDDNEMDTTDDDRSVEIFESDSQFSHGSSDKHEEHTSDDDSMEILDPTSHGWSKGKSCNIGRVEDKSFEKSKNISSPRKRGRLRKQGRSATSMVGVKFLDMNPPTFSGSFKSKAFNNIGHVEEKSFGRVHEIGSSSKSKASNIIGHVEQESYGKGRPSFSPWKRDRPRKQETSASPMDSLPSPFHAKTNKPKVSYNKSCMIEEDADQMLVPRTLSFTKSRRLFMSRETEQAVRAAIVSKLGNPSFMLILKPYIMKGNIVNVPVEFVRRHNLDRCSTDIQLQAHNEKQRWPAKCTFTASRVRISQGWGPFAASENLKEGDVCVFELISKQKQISLKVWIYRAADYAAEPIPKRIITE